MIEQIFTILSSALYENYWIAVMASFGWGILSVLLSPCHLTSIPLVVGFIASQGKISLKRSFNVSLVFALGILLTIAVIGIITAGLGRLMGDIGVYGNYLVSIIFFIAGFYLLDILKPNWNFKGLKKTGFIGLSGALILGLLFGTALGPCTFAYMAPVLGVVFQTAKTNFTAASVLLFAFGIGHCSVIVSAGGLTGKVQQYLNWSEKSSAILWIKRVCGVLVIAGGVYFLLTA